MIKNKKQSELILKQIFNEIINYKESDISLLSGSMGNVIFLSYYFKLIKKKNQKIITDQIENIFNLIPNQPIHTFCSGIAGIGWAIEHLVQNDMLDADAHEILQDINDFLFKLMIIELKHNNYDFLHGSTGIALYFLKCKTSDIKIKYLYDYIEKLYKIAERDIDGTIKWHSINKNETGDKIYDLGLAHGISSLVVILSKIYKEDINRKKTFYLLSGAVKFLLKQEQDVMKFKSYFPYSVNGESKSKYSRLAWCYGDLGIAFSLYQAAKSTNNKVWEEKAIEVLMYTTKRKELNDNLVFDAGICHGSAGIAHIYYRMFWNTKNEVYKESAIYWYEKTLEFNNFPDGLAGYKAFRHEKYGGSVNEYGILEGIAGIGLALISAISDEEPKWDECLLLS